MKIIKVLGLFFVVLFVGCVFTSGEKSDDALFAVEAKQEIESKEVFATRAANSSYAISNDILAYFVHFCQRDAGKKSSYYPNAHNTLPNDAGRACCPTSYMMAAACLAQYKEKGASDYRVNASKLAEIVGSVGSDYIMLTALSNYCNSADRSFLASESKNTQDRATIKSFMEKSLQNNKFVIVSINAHTYDPKIVNQSELFDKGTHNPDLGPNPAYISKEGLVPHKIGGHVILLIAINTDITGDGVVTYIDPLARTRNGSNRRYVRYSTLLNSMLICGEIKNQYDAISVGLRK